MSHVSLSRPESVTYDPKIVIDQLVVDGWFDHELEPGETRRGVHLRTVGMAAVGASWHSDAEFGRTLEKLCEDPRFIGLDVEGGYIFEPVVSEGSVARPSWRSIVAGNRRCTDEERDRVLTAMLHFTDFIYAEHRGGTGVVTHSQMRQVLFDSEQALRERGVDLNYESYGAFLKFISLDNNPYFHKLSDGRVVLNWVDPSTVEPLKLVTDIDETVRGLVYEWLDGGTQSVHAKDLWKALMGRGYYVTLDQRSRYDEIMRTIPGMVSAGRGWYQYAPRTSEDRQRTVAAELRRARLVGIGGSGKRGHR